MELNQYRMFYIRLKSSLASGGGTLSRYNRHMMVQVSGHLKVSLLRPPSSPSSSPSNGGGELELLPRKPEALGLIVECRLIETSPSILELSVPQTSFTSTVGLENMRILTVDSDVREVLGFEPEDFVGSEICDYFHPSDCAKTLPCKMLLQRTGYSVSPIMRFMTSSGEWAWLQMEAIVRFKEGTREPQFLEVEFKVLSQAKGKVKLIKQHEFYSNSAIQEASPLPLTHRDPYLDRIPDTPVPQTHEPVVSGMKNALISDSVIDSILHGREMCLHELPSSLTDIVSSAGEAEALEERNVQLLMSVASNMAELEKASKNSFNFGTKLRKLASDSSLSPPSSVGSEPSPSQSALPLPSPSPSLPSQPPSVASVHSSSLPGSVPTPVSVINPHSIPAHTSNPSSIPPIPGTCSIPPIPGSCSIPPIPGSSYIQSNTSDPNSIPSISNPRSVPHVPSPGSIPAYTPSPGSIPSISSPQSIPVNNFNSVPHISNPHSNLPVRSPDSGIDSPTTSNSDHTHLELGSVKSEFRSSLSTSATPTSLAVFPSPGEEVGPPPHFFPPPSTAIPSSFQFGAQQQQQQQQHLLFGAGAIETETGDNLELLLQEFIDQQEPSQQQLFTLQQQQPFAPQQQQQSQEELFVQQQQQHEEWLLQQQIQQHQLVLQQLIQKQQLLQQPPNLATQLPNGISPSSNSDLSQSYASVGPSPLPPQSTNGYHNGTFPLPPQSTNSYHSGPSPLTSQSNNGYHSGPSPLPPQSTNSYRTDTLPHQNLSIQGSVSLLPSVPDPSSVQYRVGHVVGGLEEEQLLHLLQ